MEEKPMEVAEVMGWYVCVRVCGVCTRSQEVWNGDLSTGYCQFVKPDNGKNVLTVDA